MMSSFGLVEGPASVAVGGLMHTAAAAIKWPHQVFCVLRRKQRPTIGGRLAFAAVKARANTVILFAKIRIFYSNLQFDSERNLALKGPIDFVSGMRFHKIALFWMKLPLRHESRRFFQTRSSSCLCFSRRPASVDICSCPASNTELAAGHLPRGIAMRNVFSIAFACLLTLFFCTTGDAKDGKRRKIKLPGHSVSLAYAVQTVSVRTSCFGPRLQAILAHIAAKTGRRPLVTSGHRPRAHRTGSLHRRCQAADIRVPGVPESRILAAARSAPGIGGIGRYCNGIVHVDTGPRRQWAHCGKSRGGILSAKRRSARRI